MFFQNIAGKSKVFNEQRGVYDKKIANCKVKRSLFAAQYGIWIWINYADSDLIWSPTNTGILPRRGYGYNPVRGLLGVYNFARVLLVALPVVTKGSLTCMHYSLHTRDLQIYRPSPIGLGTYLILPLKDLTGGIWESTNHNQHHDKSAETRD